MPMPSGAEVEVRSTSLYSLKMDCSCLIVRFTRRPACAHFSVKQPYRRYQPKSSERRAGYHASRPQARNSQPAAFSSPAATLALSGRTNQLSSFAHTHNCCAGRTRTGRARQQPAWNEARSVGGRHHE